MGLKWWSVVSVGIIAILVVVIWSIRRHRDPKLNIQTDAPVQGLVNSLAGITLGTAVPGNSVELLANGRFFDVIEARIRSARKTVHFETFLWKDGQLGRRMAAAFMDRARAGVQVRLMLDDAGSRRMGREVIRQLRDAGCRVRFFHKRSLRNLGVLNDRDHRKILIVDGREAFVGGHCIVDEWLGDGEDGQHFADLSVWLHGPIVNAVQGAFSENWAGETGEIFVGDDVFPRLEPAGDVTMHAVYAKPENSAPANKILHHTVICLARQRIWIQNPYFIPEPAAIDAFGDAVKRGVDVRVLMPSTAGSDNPVVQHAGHRNFEKLLECGVKLFEYPHTLLHQKVMTVDGIWSAIGSTNFDDRSFENNDEITLAVLDGKFTRELDAVFEKYVKRAETIDLDRWRHRPAMHKAVDNLFYTFKSFF